MVGSAWRRYLVTRDDVIGLILEGSLSEGVALDERQGTARFNHVRRAIADLKDTFESDAAARVRAARARADRATVRLTLMVVSTLIATAIGVYLVNRRAALEGLLRSEAHKGSILQAVPDPIISADAAGHIIELNEAAERTFGVGRAEALGARIETVILPTERRGSIADLLPPTEDPARTISPRIETVGARRDGSEFPMEVAAVTHMAGRDRIWTVHVSDMTGRRHAEEQLRRAKDAAEVAGRAKSDFLATMSHELRTPLSGVVGIADLLQAAELPAPQREMIRMLRSSATALLGLVSDVLDFSRIEAGLTRVMPVAFSIRACIEDALDPVTDLAARKGLAIGYVLEPSVPDMVISDQNRVRQVLLNLLSNAVKFTDAGEVAVRVSARPAPDDQVTISITVSDTGCGIPGALHHNLFDWFSQVDATGTRRHRGAGLGLPISERLSRVLGGSLSVASREGCGANFTFVLTAPVPRGDVPDDPLAGSFEGARVLAFLRPDIVGQQVCSLLAGWGAHATIVTDPAASLAAVGDARVGAFVVDADALDGRLYAAALTARAISNAERIPMIVITRLRPAGMDQCDAPDQAIATPVRASALHDALCGAMGPRVPAAQKPAGTAASATFDRDTLTILLVEDNDPNRRVFQMMLAELGLEVDEAGGGVEAVERARLRHYDVIFMDVQMPGLDGFEATRRIRAEQRGKPPMIIALTANVMEGDESRCREAGMDGYLPKPIRLDTLAAVLARSATEQS